MWRQVCNCRAVARCRLFEGLSQYPSNLWGVAELRTPALERGILAVQGKESGEVSGHSTGSAWGLGRWHSYGLGQASPISESCLGLALEVGSPLPKFCSVIQNSDDPSCDCQLFVYNGEELASPPIDTSVYTGPPHWWGVDTAPHRAKGKMLCFVS